MRRRETSKTRGGRGEFLRIHPVFFAIAIPAAAVLAPFFIFLCLDSRFPLDLSEKTADFAVTVVAEDDTPLRAFPDARGIWRYPVTPDGVSPLYLTALIHYEDRYFRYHPGVNPWSLCRALWACVRSGKIVSGGSTLTMQVARIFYPHSRAVGGKLYQIFRALQLEYYYTKDEILTFYLNYAPFGGPIEGVRAAAHAYLGKSPAELSHAEAALLAVLPQSPTRLRPDRHPERAARGRDKVLDRMGAFGVWDAETVADARMEAVRPLFDDHPMMAPLLARRARAGWVAAAGSGAIRTWIDPALQESLESMIRSYVAPLPAGTSAAALVLENETLAVKAYVGSADFLDDSRYGHVDMIRAARSPGSTLKPFLYAFAIEDGLIHSESLLVDAPFTFNGYSPANFSSNFSGPVSAAEALGRSLNIPAVDLLDRLEPRYFDARLRQGGLDLAYPDHAGPNLSMILGGVGVSLENLTAAFTALASDGLAGRPRFTRDAPIRRRRMMSPGAAWIIRRVLADNRRPDLPWGQLEMAESRRVAWKTGTSYGFRDAWTVGVTDRHAVGVWVGRPDGTPSPGQHGRATAAPLLFAIIDTLPRHWSAPPPIPEGVSRIEICWPLGTAPDGGDDPHCQDRRYAWTLNGLVPPTLPDRNDRHWMANPVAILINPATGLRVEADCPAPDPVVRLIARWPMAAGPWLKPRQRRASRIPRLDPICQRPVASAADTVRIMGISPETVFRAPGARTRLPAVTLQAQGGRGGLFWMLDGAVIARAGLDEPRVYQFDRTGTFTLTVMDLGGNYDSVRIRVLGG